MLTQSYLKSIVHYNPLTGIFTRLKTGKEANSLATNGYIQISIGNMRTRKVYGAHRLAWFYMTGTLPENEIDHIDQDKQNNRIINLREASSTINKRNSPKQKNNTSGVNGVSWCKRDKRWYARIKIDGKVIHLGSFKDINDARVCRLEANIKYKFSPNHGLTPSRYTKQ